MFGMKLLTHPKALLVSAVLVTGALAGCAASDDVTTDGPAFASFDEAMNADGQVFSPTNDDETTIRLKMLQPVKLDGLEATETDIVVLLYDAEKGEAITDADISMDAIMPEMGHGTSPEEDPGHIDYGVYDGMTNFSMEGDWELQFTANTPDGGVYEFVVPTSIGHGHSDDGHGHEH